MFKTAFSPFQRLLALVALALVLPTVVLLVLEVSFSLREERSEVEGLAVDRATQISALVDGRLSSDLSAMRVLAIAQTAEKRDWEGFTPRARRVAALNPGWKAVIITDLNSGRQVLDTSETEPTQDRPMQARFFGSALNPTEIGGVFRDGRNCPCVALNEPLGGEPSLVMTVLVDTGVYLDLLQPLARSSPTAGVVDRNGLFIARNLAHEQRVGTPASTYVREAVRRGGEGVYPGVTLEGLKSYTAYHTSTLSGWSVHIAVPARVLDQPSAWTNRVRIGGAVVALALAGGLIALALNELAMRRREEESLRQTQKLEALGRLTGGVAHDFNNLLTVIIGSLDMLAARLNEPVAQRLAERGLEAARRGARLTGQLLTFSRNQRVQVASTDVGALIEGMDDLLRQSVGANIDLQIDVVGAPLWASTDASQLEFAILNLVLNARDAMPKGGELAIAAGQALEPEFIAITVRDSGHGMDRSVAERALEPFFTTKPADEGTGLGLAQVFGTVQQSGGSMTIDSTPGRGTMVRLLLPRSAPGPSRGPRITEGYFDGPERATVLVVDDEEAVRMTMAEALAISGYTVDEAANGELAMAALRARPYDLLLTDFAMPGMNGAELAARARALRPGLKIVIVSGYADTAAINAARVDAPLLAKPVDVKALRDAVRSALST